MKNLLLRVTSLLLCILLYGGTAVWAQDGTAPDPLANCPPSNTQHCIYVSYPAIGVSTCDVEVCLERDPTTYLQSLCPVAWNGGYPKQCITLSPGQVAPFCFDSPAGDVNTWFTFKLTAHAVGIPYIGRWNIIPNQPFAPVYQPGGCNNNSLVVGSTDGETYTLTTDLIEHI